MAIASRDRDHAAEPTHLHRRVAVFEAAVAELTVFVVAPGHYRAVGQQREAVDSAG